MGRTKPNRTELMQTAAEWRAKGASWEQVARETGLASRTLRRWRTTHSEEWNASLQRAEAEIVTEALGEAIRALRNQLRSDEPADVREAAKQLLGFRVQLLKLLNQNTGESPATFDTILEGLTHDFGPTKKTDRRGTTGGSESTAGCESLC